MGQREWDTDQERERKRAYRERKRLETSQLSAAREQEIRGFFGYSASETRTKAERDAAAARMVEFAQEQWGDVELTGFPARPGDLAPSAKDLAKLGGLWPGR